MILKASFFLLSIITTGFLFTIGFKAVNATSERPKTAKSILVVGLLIWHIFIFLLSNSELLKNFDFPPRFAIAFIFPSFLFTGIFLFINRNKKWIHTIPQHWIIYFQSFRIVVEILFVLACAIGVFNYHVTIEGYNYDMIFAFTAPVIGLLVYRWKILPKSIIRIWNYLGILVLMSVIVLFMISIYKPEFFGSDKSLLPMKAISYPFTLIASFLMPTAVFLHVLSLIQLKKSKL